ncbi:hypothetical protein K439DRAFT_876741 [Ramaria rubella]|nr:hypothetical protein K439DRAFT_876741 [Ramaria rubella]
MHTYGRDSSGENTNQSPTQNLLLDITAKYEISVLIAIGRPFRPLRETVSENPWRDSCRSQTPRRSRPSLLSINGQSNFNMWSITVHAIGKSKFYCALLTSFLKNSGASLTAKIPNNQHYVTSRCFSLHIFQRYKFLRTRARPLDKEFPHTPQPST